MCDSKVYCAINQLLKKFMLCLKHRTLNCSIHFCVSPLFPYFIISGWRYVSISGNKCKRMDYFGSEKAFGFA